MSSLRVHASLEWNKNAGGWSTGVDHDRKQRYHELKTGCFSKLSDGCISNGDGRFRGASGRRYL